MEVIKLAPFLQFKVFVVPISAKRVPTKEPPEIHSHIIATVHHDRKIADGLGAYARRDLVIGAGHFDCGSSPVSGSFPCRLPHALLASSMHNIFLSSSRISVFLLLMK